MATFREILTRLFTRNVVIKRLPGGRLKTLDVNKSQSTGSPTTYGTRAKWRNGRNFNSTSGYGSGFTNEEFEAIRKQMYIDYELMDTDSIVSSVLDICSDESSTLSEYGELLVIKTEDVKIKKILHNLFYDVLNIEFNLWSWIRTTLKFGDSFLYLQIAEEIGVVNVMPIHPSLMIREEGTLENPDQIRFRYEGDYGFSYGAKNYFENFEVAHFRMLGDTNFLPYGKSYLEGARKEYKRMLLMEDAMMISRIMRAPERRLFKIDIGNIAPEEVDAYMEQITNEMKKVPYIDQATGDFDLRYNVQNSTEDYFLPVRGGETGTAIETLPGLQNDGMKEDVEYFKNKMISALKVPKEYLGYADEGGGEKSGIAQIDLRFARTIERIQKIFVSELYKIAVTHLYVQGFRDDELLNFELNLTNPSLIYERQRVDILTAKVDLVKSIREDNLFSDKYIYETIFGMTENEWKSDRDQLRESAKFKFIMKELAEAGNDPEKSFRSFTTAYDLASLQVASKLDVNSPDEIQKLYTPDGREENEGKPEQFGGSFETKRDQDFGRDPVGRRDLEKQANPAQESVKKIIKGLNKFNKKDKKPLNENSLLDDDKLIDDEDI